MLLYGLGGCVWSQGGWCGEWDWCMSSPTLLLGPLPRPPSIPISWKTDLTQGLTGRMGNQPFSQCNYEIFLPLRDESYRWGIIIISFYNLSSSSLCFHSASFYSCSVSVMSKREGVLNVVFLNTPPQLWKQKPHQPAGQASCLRGNKKKEGKQLVSDTESTCNVTPVTKKHNAMMQCNANLTNLCFIHTKHICELLKMRHFSISWKIEKRGG